MQEHLREVRDLTEALTKDESVLINHDLANEPERSVSHASLLFSIYSILFYSITPYILF